MDGDGAALGVQVDLAEELFDVQTDFALQKEIAPVKRQLAGLRGTGHAEQVGLRRDQGQAGGGRRRGRTDFEDRRADDARDIGAGGDTPASDQPTEGE